MKNGTMKKLQIGLTVLAMLVLIVMNVFTFGAVMLNVFRAILAICLIGIGILIFAPRKLESR